MEHGGLTASADNPIIESRVAVVPRAAVAIKQSSELATIST